MKGWDKSWAYLKEFGKNIEYYPTGTGRTMQELGQGSRDMILSTAGWDINPRALGIVPKSVTVGQLKGFHWVSDAQYLMIPKGVPPARLAVLLDLVTWMLQARPAGLHVRCRVFLSRPCGEGCAGLDGAGGEPQGAHGIRSAGIR